MGIEMETELRETIELLQLELDEVQQRYQQIVTLMGSPETHSELMEELASLLQMADEDWQRLG